MISKEILKLYEDVKDHLKFISSSSVRGKIMICLNEGAVELTDLKENLDLDSSTILHAMSKLEERNLILKEGNTYVLSQKGYIIVLKFIDMIKTLVTVQRNEKLWLNHEINDIPPEMILRMGELSTSKLVESELTNVFKPLETFSQILMDSERIRGLSPIFNPDFIETFKLMVQIGKDVELIFTPQIIKEMMDVLDPASMMELLELIKKDKIKIWTMEHDVKIAFTVTDKFVSIGLFSSKGDYDTTKDLISDNPDAVTWGNNLFDYYRRRSRRFIP